MSSSENGIIAVECDLGGGIEVGLQKRIENVESVQSELSSILSWNGVKAQKGDLRDDTIFHFKTIFHKAYGPDYPNKILGLAQKGILKMSPAEMKKLGIDQKETVVKLTLFQNLYLDGKESEKKLDLNLLDQNSGHE
jgi:hypothetical protein